MTRLARIVVVAVSASIVAVAAVVFSIIGGAGWEDEEHDETELEPWTDPFVPDIPEEELD